jgi:hypothetical protein
MYDPSVSYPLRRTVSIVNAPFVQKWWFSAQDLTKRGSETVLHELFGISPSRQDRPSPSLLQNCYGPTVLKEEEGHRMWFADVSGQSGLS